MILIRFSFKKYFVELKFHCEYNLCIYHNEINLSIVIIWKSVKLKKNIFLARFKYIKAF